VPPGDPTALAKAIMRFVEQPELAQACGRRGREHVVRNHSRERMIERVLGVYERLMACN
jgi:glycosyltransferase involved in cell wall biosynthesis